MESSEPVCTNAELATFCRQFASLLHAKLNIIDIFEALREQTANPALREIIDSLRIDEENGRTLATAFSRYPHVFSPFFISMVRQGELEGELDRVFGELARHYASPVDEEAETARLELPATQIAATAGWYRWLVIWLAGLFAACLAGAGIAWFAVLETNRTYAGPVVLMAVAAIIVIWTLLLGRQKWLP
jgi:type IV pilus assembly protein PilC